MPTDTLLSDPPSLQQIQDLVLFAGFHSHSNGRAWFTTIWDWLQNSFDPLLVLSRSFNPVPPSPALHKQWCDCVESILKLRSRFQLMGFSKLDSQCDLFFKVLPFLLLSVPKSATRTRCAQIHQRRFASFLQGAWPALVTEALSRRPVNQYRFIEPDTGGAEPNPKIRAAMNKARSGQLSNAMRSYEALALPLVPMRRFCLCCMIFFLTENTWMLTGMPFDKNLVCIGIQLSMTIMMLGFVV